MLVKFSHIEWTGVYVNTVKQKLAICGLNLLAMLALCVGLSQVSIAQENVPPANATARLGVSATQPESGPFVKIDGGFMVSYSAEIPATGVKFQMIPVPGGTFTMGSPDDEEGRLKDEGPQFEVVVKPFWIGKYEVSWEEYQRFMDMDDVFKELARTKVRAKLEKFSVDALTAPSALYDADFTFSAGEEYNQPAATISQFAAKQYTKWLSVTSKDFYRLPYEAEWEYACRAGAKTAYSFGDDVDELEDHAWFVENSDEERHAAGEKKPNAFGLFDMHGNVAEWVLDGYNEKGYTHLKAGQKYTVEETFSKPKTIYSRVVRGGSWELDDVQCRCAARLASAEEWKDEDPNQPQSPWWFTDSPGLGVGFRLIRPLEVPKTMEAKNEFWKPDVEAIAENAAARIDENGRGALGSVDEKLPAEMEKALDDM